MAGAASLSGDPKLRTPMSWTADTVRAGFSTGQPFRSLSGNVATANVGAQTGVAGSLLEFYRSVIALRKSLPSLQRGAYQGASTVGELMVFQRVLGSERTVVAFNYGISAGTIQAKGLAAGATLRSRLPAGGADVLADPSGVAALAIPAQSFAVLVVAP